MSEHLAVLITDIVGSTAFTQTQGDEAAMGVIRAHERLVHEVVAEHAGREIKSMGDGAMMAFEHPDAAVRTALDIVDRLHAHNASHPDEPIFVRMGINYGPVIEEGGDLYGTTVNAAARITAKARSGQILVSESVRESAEGTFLDRGLFWLKGLRERWRLFEATRHPDDASTASALEGRTPFVDREDERAALRLYVDAALDGRGALVLLSGEPGTGKSRLADEIGMEAEGRGMRRLIGRCFEPSIGQPFGPIVDVLERVEREISADEFRALLGESAPEVGRLLPHIRRRFPDVAPPTELPPDQERRYLFTSIRDVLATLGRERPLFLHIDDLHWADEQTLLFLEQLAADLQRVPVLIVATYSHPELASSRPLQAVLERLLRQRTSERFVIAALGSDDVRDLLFELGGSEPPASLVAALFRETEGNAFFLEEIVRHLDAQGRLLDGQGGWLPYDASTVELPETVRMTIGRRLEAVSDEAKHVLTLAAIIGRAFGFDLLGAVSDLPEDGFLDALDDAERAHLVTSADDGGLVRFTFSHELIRQTLISEVSLTRRQLLHLRAADAMERVYADSISEHAADLAYHLVEAGRRADRAKTLRFLVMAGERALEAAAYEDAARHFDRALPFADPDDHGTRAPILEKLALSERSLGHLDEAIATWTEAVDAYDAIGDRDMVAKVCLDAGIQVAWWMRNRDADRLVARGLEALEGRESAYLAGLIALEGVIAGNEGHYERASELLEDAVTIARRQGDERVLGHVLYSKAVYHFTFVQNMETIEVGTEAIECLRSGRDLWSLTNVIGFVGQSLGFVGRFDEAAEVTEGAKELAAQLGNWVAYIYIDRARAWRHLAHAPSAAKLEEAGQRDLELGMKLGYRWMSAVGLTRMSHASFIRGDWDEAIERANAAAEYESGPLQGHYGRLVLLHAYRGNRDEALRHYEELKRWEVPAPGEPSRFGVWGAFLAALEGLAMLGERDEAATLYQWATLGNEHRRLFRGWDYRLEETMAGVAAGCARRWDEAEQHFHAAIKLAEELPYVLEQPEAYRFYARMLLDRAQPGDRERADDLLAKAEALYSSLQMPRHVELTAAMRLQIA